MYVSTTFCSLWFIFVFIMKSSWINVFNFNVILPVFDNSAFWVLYRKCHEDTSAFWVLYGKCHEDTTLYVFAKIKCVFNI